jgi:hypothetical protein
MLARQTEYGIPRLVGGVGMAGRSLSQEETTNRVWREALIAEAMDILSGACPHADDPA